MYVVFGWVCGDKWDAIPEFFAFSHLEALFSIVATGCKKFCLFGEYSYHQRETLVPVCSPKLSPVGPVGRGLISGWVTILIKYPVLYSMGSQAGVVDINHAFHLHYKCCM